MYFLQINIVIHATLNAKRTKSVTLIILSCLCLHHSGTQLCKMVSMTLQAFRLQYFKTYLKPRFHLNPVWYHPNKRALHKDVLITLTQLRNVI